MATEQCAHPTGGANWASGAVEAGGSSRSRSSVAATGATSNRTCTAHQSCDHPPVAAVQRCDQGAASTSRYQRKKVMRTRNLEHMALLARELSPYATLMRSCIVTPEYVNSAAPRPAWSHPVTGQTAPGAARRYQHARWPLRYGHARCLSGACHMDGRSGRERTTMASHHMTGARSDALPAGSAVVPPSDSPAV